MRSMKRSSSLMLGGRFRTDVYTSDMTIGRWYRRDLCISATENSFVQRKSDRGSFEHYLLFDGFDIHIFPSRYSTHLRLSISLCLPLRSWCVRLTCTRLLCLSKARLARILHDVAAPGGHPGFTTYHTPRRVLERLHLMSRHHNPWLILFLTDHFLYIQSNLATALSFSTRIRLRMSSAPSIPTSKPIRDLRLFALKLACAPACISLTSVQSSSLLKYNHLQKPRRQELTTRA